MHAKMLGLGVAYALGGGALVRSNDFGALLATQLSTLIVLGAVAVHRGGPAPWGLRLWSLLFAASLTARLVVLAATRASPVNKAAKLRRWDAAVTTLGYGVAIGYLMTAVVPGRSLSRYLVTTTVVVPTAAAASTLFDRPGTSIAQMEAAALVSARAYNSPSFVASDTDTRILVDGDVVAFAGTDSVRNVLTDINIADVHPDWMPGRARVHLGFSRAYDTVRDQVLEANPTTVVGHSLGGALATLAALDLFLTNGTRATVITFGSPQVGDELFVDAFNDAVAASARVVHPLDPVPKALTSQFAHVKGMHAVSAVGQPHDLDVYLRAVRMGAGDRAFAVLLPLALVAGVGLLLEKRGKTHIPSVPQHLP